MLHSTRLNDKLSNSVVKPKSVAMEKMAPCQKKWKREWYTTWYTRKHNPNKEEEKRERARRKMKEPIRKSKMSKNPFEEEELIIGRTGLDDPEILEIGNIYTSNFRGEKASRIHPSFISYINKSRWRKKYFSKRTFSHS